jgi:hypothetical protein
VRPHPLLVDTQTSIQPFFFPKDYVILLPPLTKVLGMNTSRPLAKVTKLVISTQSLQSSLCRLENIYQTISRSVVMCVLKSWHWAKAMRTP